jgi:hypothetical protein
MWFFERARSGLKRSIDPFTVSLKIMLPLWRSEH